MIYVEVPDGVGDATSVREILDGKYPLHPARGWMAALTPPDVGLGATPRAVGRRRRRERAGSTERQRRS